MKSISLGKGGECSFISNTGQITLHNHDVLIGEAPYLYWSKDLEIGDGNDGWVKIPKGSTTISGNFFLHHKDSTLEAYNVPYTEDDGVTETYSSIVTFNTTPPIEGEADAIYLDEDNNMNPYVWSEDTEEYKELTPPSIDGNEPVELTLDVTEEEIQLKYDEEYQG